MLSTTSFLTALQRGIQFSTETVRYGYLAAGAAKYIPDVDVDTIQVSADLNQLMIDNFPTFFALYVCLSLVSACVKLISATISFLKKNVTS